MCQCFEVGMAPREFCDRYREHIADMGVVDSDTREQVEQMRTAIGLAESDLVLGQYRYVDTCYLMQKSPLTAILLGLPITESFP